ncbi:MAG: transposase [Phycisphaerales bacterium]|nr:transposase [Phycisphaerales bacterium]
MRARLEAGPTETDGLCTLTKVWARAGSRPTAVKQTRHEWVDLYAAVEPGTGHSVALRAPQVNTGTFSVFLRMLGESTGPDEHAVLIMDQAGWHVSRKATLPPSAPELTPVDHVGPDAQPSPVQPGLSRLRPPARSQSKGLAVPHQVQTPIPLPMRILHARDTTVIRMTGHVCAHSLPIWACPSRQFESRGNQPAGPSLTELAGQT